MPRLQRTLILAVAMGALAFVLSACGRKGALDPPPGGYQLEQQSGKTPVSRRGETPPSDPQDAYDENGRPIAPKGPKKHLPADWLLD